jgi:hypothetical protein
MHRALDVWVCDYAYARRSLVHLFLLQMVRFGRAAAGFVAVARGVAWRGVIRYTSMAIAYGIGKFLPIPINPNKTIIHIDIRVLAVGPSR